MKGVPTSPAACGAVLGLLAVFMVTTPAAAQTRERRAVTAYPVTTPITIDGTLNEAFYRTVQPASDFIQIEPQDGAPATEKTEMWIGFDRDTLYLSFRCWESRMDRVVAKEMRRDNSAIWGGDDVVVFYLDTFNDGRNGVQFVINSIGGRTDGQASNDGAYNGDFNMIWDVSTGRFDGGWIIETAVPFKSLRYQPGTDQLWGINVVRTNRWKNELSFLNPVPKERGQAGVHFSSVTGLLQGIVAPSGSRNLELKPYAISNATGRAVAGRGLQDDLAAEVGVDAKYGLTQNLTVDLTYNTDFAQVEADQQQVNLTRFSLFFPEKRDFFLENQGMFTFGGASNQSTADNVPILFYSRRIGLEGGQAVPIRGGGRLTGRVGRYTLGLINIQTGEEPATSAQPTNFSVVRMRRDILRRSSVGLLLTGRTTTGTGLQNNAAYGVDGTFGFFQSLSINTYWARTEDHLRAAPAGSGDRTSYRGQLDYNGDRYGVQLERLAVGDAFNPGVGFLRRSDIRRSFGQARFSPRPRRNGVVRKYSWTGSVNYVENGAGRLETREREAEFGIDFQNADRLTATYTGTFEYLPRPFRIANRVTLPVGDYDFDTVRLAYNRANRQRVAGNLTAETGTFYNGRKTAFGLAAGRVNFSPRFSVEPTYSVNWVDLTEGQFTSQLFGSRMTFTSTPFMFTSALLQYNSDTHSLSTNVRFRWEYRPGSELFIVYNDERDTFARAFPDLTNRAFIIKINRLFRL
ncbi:MAG: carbohydrate binding family 9 domain-containing protein [Acidobacteria bacterium]|nr:carbohydrate binding family 9 domain-containing protein [Acidobacteriota bacterium]